MNGDMNYMRKQNVLLLLMFASCMRCVFGYGPWLEWPPLGGVELGD